MTRYPTAVVLTAALAGGSWCVAGNVADTLAGEQLNVVLADDRTDTDVSPARRIKRGPRPPRSGEASFRTIDGSGNNVADTLMGATFIQLLRYVPADYSDGVTAMAGTDRPSARAVSNAVFAQSEDLPNAKRASDYLWQWGQFLDHDIDLTDGTDPRELQFVSVPTGDVWFDPDGTGQKTIAFNRSIYDESSGTDAGNPRQQLNEITGWIDASNVYGSEDERAQALRLNDGTGRMELNQGLLPPNRPGLANAGGSGPELFLAGDVRANEQVGLTAMHTLFVREHNRLAALIAQREPSLRGDEIYELARRLVGAEMQVITYEEYLPALLGRDALRPYRGYKPNVDARIANVFSTAAYRYGHSALSPTLLRLDADGNEIEEGHLPLRSAFFSPWRIEQEGGIEPLLRGLAHQVCQTVDAAVIDDVRNFLFGEPGSGGFDLVSLNIQRGRDHGLPSYNDAREALGFPRALGFHEIHPDPAVQSRLATVYDDVDDVDLWVGGLSERPVEGSHLGPLFHSIVSRQFEALRDGDHYWYEQALTPDERDLVQGLRLSDVIRLNTAIGDEIQDDVFHVRGPGGGGPGGGGPGGGGPGGGGPGGGGPGGGGPGDGGPGGAGPN